MCSTPLQVMIIGGGIGGLCLAQGLKAAGVGVAVYERNPARVWPEGYRIHINPVGSKALRECLPPMLWETFIGIAGKSPAGLGFMTEALTELVVIAEAFMSNTAPDSADGHHPINRIALRHLLLARMQDVVRFGKTFERYEQASDGTVTAFVADGSAASGDVLVGADGANSKVRQQYLPQSRRVETGAVGIGGKLPLNEQTRAWLPQQLSTRMNLILPPSRYALFSAAFDRAHASADELNRIRERAEAAGLDQELLLDNAQDYMLWAFIAHADAYSANTAKLDGRALQQLLGRMIEGWHPTLRRLIAASDPISVSLNPFKTSVRIPSWESTNVTLLGDAIHNMPPVGGLGGNMALRDASQLARALVAVQRGELPLVPAIHTYEADMLAYGFDAVDAALEYTRQAISANRLAREIGKTWFRVCNLVPPLRRAFEAQWTRPMRSSPRRAAV